MKKGFLNFVILSILSVVAGHAYSTIDCPVAKVDSIQIEGANIYAYPEGQHWHLVGHLETIGTKERYSAILAAQIAGKKIILRYPDGYDCSLYELSTPAVMVRLLNE